MTAPAMTRRAVCTRCLALSCLCDQAEGGAWRDHARCHPDHHPDRDSFTPAGYKGRANLDLVRQAKRWCNGNRRYGVPPCPVRAVCLAYAHVKGDDWSVLGGTTPRERRAARARLDRPRTPAEPAPPGQRRAPLPEHTLQLIRDLDRRGWARQDITAETGASDYVLRHLLGPKPREVAW
ncbi:MAG: WhiB family transcriptional regulator [Pseudonocardia sp.]